MWKRALVSVSDKTGLVDFLKPLQNDGLEIYSTGGSAKFLIENGLFVHDVNELTGFPEVLGGRVKTLHPSVHMGLLARKDNSEDMQTLQRFNVEMFDLVVVNLYPFEAALKDGKTGMDLIEKIDVGGPTMLRAAAKNNKYISVFCDPTDYKMAADFTEANRLQMNLKLAAKVFAQTAAYDSMIASALYPAHGGPETLAFDVVQDLRYGENPHQQAKWFSDKASSYGWQQAKIIQGKELSYNNLLDLDAALTCVRMFTEAACVAVKHNNPCGVGESHGSVTEAVSKAIKADPISVFGGIVAVNREVGKDEANLLSEIFLECVVAPKFSEEALQIFAKKKNLRILSWPQMLDRNPEHSLRQIAGGWLKQQVDQVDSDHSQWKFMGEKPSEKILKDLIFAEKCAAALKSNSIAIVREQQSLGFGMGQVNRVEAVQHAITRAGNHHSGMQEAVLASDAFFPFKDSIEVIAKAGIKWVLQPGGSIKDQEVIEAAAELKVNLVLTGKRHFRH